MYIKNRQYFKFVMFLSKEVEIDMNFYMKKKFIESIDKRLYYIGQFSSCKVYDHFPVKRCNKCQKFGRFHANCNANHTCVHCAGEHPSDQCTAKAASE